MEYTQVRFPVCVVVGLSCLVGSALGQESKPARPSTQQVLWHDYEIGMFIHFGLWNWPSGINEKFKTIADVQKNFNPVELDTDQWVAVAESMGAKFIVYTAKHTDGFCMWQTDTTDVSIKNTPWRGGKGDIMADLAESCRKRGMKLGVYLNPQNPGVGLGGKCTTPEAQEEYNQILRRQLTELLTRYGEIIEVWFDGGLVVPAKDILEKYAPNAMVFQSPQATIRWVGNEAGHAPYPAWNSVNTDDPTYQIGLSTARHGTPDGNKWLPLECDARIRAHWGYRDNNLHTLKTVESLMEMYYRSVGHGALLLLNHTPDRTGLIPEPDVQRAAEFGAEIKRRFSKSIAETSGQGEVVELAFDQPINIDHVITMEDILQGERVREYVLEGLIDGNWQTMVEGISIGHKKIDRFDPVEVAGVRMRVTKSSAKPMIRELAVYNTAAEVSAGKTSSPHGYDTVWTWNPELVKTAWAGIELDLSPYIDDARQYELLFKKTSGENELQVRSAVLVLEGVETPGFAEPLDSPNRLNINITATPSGKPGSIKLRATVRGKDGTDTHGMVLIQKVPIE